MITIHTTNLSASVFPKELLENSYAFPEVSNGIPLTPAEIIRECTHTLTQGKPIVTVSEHIILFALFCVRKSMGDYGSVLTPIHLTCDELHVFYHDGKQQIRLRVDSEGEFIDRWPNGFFRDRADLLF